MRQTIPALLFSLLVSPAGAGDYTGRVVGISDGDTLTVLRDGRTQVKVRLHGIDAPESGQDFGARDKQATSELAFGQVVNVEPRDLDRYGRTVAVVLLADGRSLNETLVRNGMAWWYRRYAPDDRQLAAAEAAARLAKRGLWAESRPVPPWEWRAGAGTAPAAPGTVVGNRSSRVFHAPTCPSVR